jgi:hypothetical protein
MYCIQYSLVSVRPHGYFQPLVSSSHDKTRRDLISLKREISKEIKKVNENWYRLREREREKFLLGCTACFSVLCLDLHWFLLCFSSLFTLRNVPLSFCSLLSFLFFVHSLLVPFLKDFVLLKYCRFSRGNFFFSNFDFIFCSLLSIRDDD